jgi:hypothetical protein
MLTMLHDSGVTLELACQGKEKPCRPAARSGNASKEMFLRFYNIY